VFEKVSNYLGSRVQTAILVSMAFLGSAIGAKAGEFIGPAVKIGHGTAHTVVRDDTAGKVMSIGVIFTPGMLEGLPTPAKGADPDFPYVLSMPTKGPKTLIDHVVINWESAGHQPSHVYDVPHFDFHFYLISLDQQKAIVFSSDKQSGEPAQQPPAELVPAGYIVPPGTAVSSMGVHAVNPTAAEFKGKPFTATFIYGYYNKRQTFIEPMVSLAFLKSKPTFSADIVRPRSYSAPGVYPSAYRVQYDAGQKRYEVMLEKFK
jgi:hypothetical protein